MLKKLNEKLPDMYNHDNLMLSSTHTHSVPGGYMVHMLFDLSTWGFVKQTLNCLVTGITLVSNVIIMLFAMLYYRGRFFFAFVMKYAFSSVQYFIILSFSVFCPFPLPYRVSGHFFLLQKLSIYELRYILSRLYWQSTTKKSSRAATLGLSVFDFKIMHIICDSTTIFWNKCVILSIICASFVAHLFGVGLFNIIYYYQQARVEEWYKGGTRWFFKRLNDDKLLSALSIVTGVVENTCNNVLIIGKTSSQCFKISITVSGFIIWILRHLYFSRLIFLIVYPFFHISSQH